MFSHNNRTQETILVVFVTLVVLGLIAGLAWFWVNYSPNKNKTRVADTNNLNTRNKSQTGTKNQDNVTLAERKREVLSSYRKQIKEQIEDIDSFNSSQKIVSDTTDFFLKVKVPKKYLDPHLQTFLEFKDKKASLSSQSVEKTKSKIKPLLEGIIE